MAISTKASHILPRIFYIAIGDNHSIMDRTDLAIEFSSKSYEEFSSEVVKRTRVTVDSGLSRKIGKPTGEYITIETSAVKEGDSKKIDTVIDEISSSLKNFLDNKSYLIVGLGNPDMTADSLGKKVLDKVVITRHLKGELENPEKIPAISGIVPNVLGVTGIESFDIIKGVCSRIKPECVVVIDSLAGATVARLASAFQITDSGITPGSGVSNHRKRLDKASLGCKVVSIGVPLVVYASTLIKNATNEKTEFNTEIGNMVVTPKDIDILVDGCANVIAGAINKVLVKELASE